MLRPGERLGSFIIEGPLGQGGMGTVYAAVDERLRRRVAVKVLGSAMASVEGKRRLIREARLMATVEHPGIVQIYELGEHGDEVYIVMELVRGRSLSGLLAELGVLPPEAVAAAGVGIAAAAAAAHEAGILHRDIKPMNVMLRKDGAIKVLDFGIAKPVEAEQMTALTRPGAVAGTPTYLAPELLHGGAATVATDVWALGVTLAELATGALPFKARSLVELILSVTSMPASIEAVNPPALREAIARMLQKKPEERPQSMLDALSELELIANPAVLRKWAEPALAAGVGADAISMSGGSDAGGAGGAGGRARTELAGSATPVPPASSASRAPDAELMKTAPSARAPGTEPGVPSALVEGEKNVHPMSFEATSAGDLLDRGTAGRGTAAYPLPDAPSAKEQESRNNAARAAANAPNAPTSPSRVYGEVLDEIAGKLSAIFKDAPADVAAVSPSSSPSPSSLSPSSSPSSLSPSSSPAVAHAAAAAPEDVAVESFPQRITLSSRSGSRPLDEDTLDAIAGMLPSLPEPLALLATNVEVARADGDSTGVRKRLFELGVGVVRYGASAGLAVLKKRLESKGKKAPAGLGAALRKAARMSDGQWCDLGRSIGSELRSADPGMMRALKFLSDKPLADLVASRNLFIHGGAHGDDAPERALAVLETAQELLALDLRLVASIDPPAFEVRRGMPIRAGVWRKSKGAVHPDARPGEAYIVLKDDWIQVTPWLPSAENRLLLVDSPHAPGKPWRSMDPESGEHREHPALDKALRALLDADASAPVPLTDRPPLVGRGQVVAVLKRAAEEAIRGGVRVVVLTGPFGIGRSLLAGSVVSAAAGLGFTRVLSAACSPERRSTLRPLRRALEGAPLGDTIREVVERAVAGDVLARREGIESAIEAVEEAIVEASLREPMILAVDDAQWADDQTLSLLRLLTERAARGARGQLLVVVTVRDEPTQAPALRRLIGQVAQEIGVAATRISLPPLAEKDAAQLIRGVGPVEPEIERSLIAGAAGVPFFLVQPLLVWSETGQLVWKEKAWGVANKEILEAAVPGVGDLVKARLASFFDPGSDAERAAHQALACVALYGAGLPLRHVVTAMATAGTKEAAAEHALETLVEAAILRMDGDRQELRFAQAIVQQALLSDLRSKPWFRRVHRALLDAAAASEEGEADAAFLAAGYEALGANAEAIAWFKRGIDKAFAMGAFEDAVSLGERLAKLAKATKNHAESRRSEFAIAQGLLRLGRAAEAKARLGDPTELVPAGIELAVEGRTLALLIAHALGEMPAEPDPTLLKDADACDDARLGIEARLALATCVRGARGVELIDVGLKRLAAVPEGAIGDLRYRLLAMRFEILWESRGGNHDECRRAVRMAADAARALGSEWAALDMETNIAVLESDAGNDAAAIALFQEIERKVSARHFGTLRRQLLVSIAGVSLRAGKLAEAAAAAAEAASVNREAGSSLLGAALSVQADALFQLGRLQEALPAIQESVELKLAANDANLAIALIRRAEIRAAMGDRSGAIADAKLAFARAQAAGNKDQAARARLWLSVEAMKASEDGAASRLQEAVDAFDQTKPLPRWTRQMLDEAKRLLG